jgi:hypothetical protein
LHVSVLPELEIATEDELCVTFFSLLNAGRFFTSVLDDSRFGFSTAEEFEPLKSGALTLSLLQATTPNAAATTRATPMCLIGFMMFLLYL